MSVDIRNLVKQCQICEEFRRFPKEPLIATPFPDRPWWRHALDYCEWKGDSYLVLVDYFSRFILARKMMDTSAKALVETCNEWFGMFGIPNTVVSDNGAQFISSCFFPFLSSHDIIHITSSPRYPQSNGEAERAVQTVKDLPNKNGNLHKALLSHRDSPLANGYSPAQSLFGRSFNSLGLLSEKGTDKIALREFETRARETQQQYYNDRHNAMPRTPIQIGEDVKIKDPTGSRTGRVVNGKGRELYIDHEGKTLRRNRSMVVRKAQVPERREPPCEYQDTDLRSPNRNAGGKQNIKISRVSGQQIRAPPKLNL